MVNYYRSPTCFSLYFHILALLSTDPEINSVSATMEIKQTRHLMW